MVPPTIPPTLGRPDQPPPTWPWTYTLRFGPPTVTRPVPLYPLLLALKEPEKPAGEVRGLGLGMWIVCIEGANERVSFKELFMILMEKIVLCSDMSRQIHTNVCLISTIPIHIFLWWWRNEHIFRIT
jgi:hypothetical protein